MARTRSALIAGVTAIGMVIGISPQPARAAMTVKARASASIEIAFGPCTENIFLYTEADFSPAAKFDEVIVTWTGPGAPLGKSGSHSFPGGASSDDFVFQWPVAGLVPGARVEAKVDWRAHTGNGLNTGFGTISVGVRIHDNPWNHKLNLEGKCVIEKQAKEYAKQAAQSRASAEKVRASCSTCASVFESVAAANESIADRLHKIALDPPDPNFTTPTTVTTVAPLSVAAGSGVTAEAATAVNDLLRLLADSSAQARAAVTAIERSQGARVAANTEWETRQSLAAADFLKALAGKLNGVPAAMQAAGAKLQAGGFPNPSITDAERAAAVGNYLETGPSNADWLRQQAGHTDADLQEIAGLLGTSSDLVTGPTPVLAGFNDPAFAASITSIVAALNASAAELIANPLVDHTGETYAPAPVSPSAPPVVVTRSPTAAEGASLLGNSGFESPALPPGTGYDTLTAAKGTGLTPWTVQKGSVDVVAGPAAQAATGGQFIDLNGNDNADGPGIITQDATVTPGRQYRLSFQLAGNPNGDPPIKTVEVSIAGQKETFTFDTKGHTNADLGWATHTMEHAACGESTVAVTFKSLTEGIRGPNLDNVVLLDVGPASCSSFPFWWIMLAVTVLLAVLAVVVVLYLRRRRSAMPTEESTSQA